MKQNALHIVCLDAPAPPNYGGAIEMFYKTKALAESGVDITLHYFSYKKDRNAVTLKPYCNQVFSYKRKAFLNAQTFSKPHIVASRINRQLIDRLNEDDKPVLLEGVHCTGIIPNIKNAHRKIIVRLHNDEAVYYNSLAASVNTIYKKLYYSRESQLLRKYQKTIPNTATYLALAQSDVDQFKNTYKLKNVYYVPAFVPWQDVSSLPGKGSFCLYHGNLMVPENEAAALWLIKNVFAHIDVPFVIAGRTQSLKLKNAIAPYNHIQLFINPTEAILETLIQDAHIHLVPDLNATGIKLKLLHALFCGRFCITNATAFEISAGLAMAQTPADYIQQVKTKMDCAFTESDIDERKKILKVYDNRTNSAKIIAHLY